MSIAIVGFGTALPITSVTQDEAVEVARKICCRTDDQAELLPSLYRHTGIRTRHLSFGPEVVCDVLQGTNTSGSVFLPAEEADDPGPTTGQRIEHYVERAGPLALQAAREAIHSSGVKPTAFTHLVTVSCTGFSAPGVDIELIKRLELRPTIERTHVGFMGCHGALNGLRVANALTGANPGARVLLCAVELCSLHYHYGWNPKKLVSNALFADGAAAVVGIPARTAPADAWRIAACGSCLFPDSEYAMTWDIGDHGFEMTLSTRVPDLIARNLRPQLESWLQENGVRLDEVASWAVHPGGPRILSAVEEALDLPPEVNADARAILAGCGNMSSPTILFILERLRRRNAPRPCVALGFGPGLAAEMLLFH
ncbi:MAG TPA: type III polyketide synthase [Gemmataceae bacterium]|nr:type III polyketide synthase [Gemmataceae bacterium]